VYPRFRRHHTRDRIALDLDLSIAGTFGELSGKLPNSVGTFPRAAAMMPVTHKAGDERHEASN